MRKVVLVVLLAGLAAGQTFEVASVRPSPPDKQRGSEGGPGTKDPINYRFTSATLLDLIAIAWHVEYFQVSSKSALDRDRFDVVVKIPEGATRDDFRLMMRNLLVERFRLKTHDETRDFPAYELVVAKSGLKIKDANAPGVSRDGFPSVPAGRPALSSAFSMSGPYMLARMSVQQQTMQSFAESIHLPDRSQPIVNRTGLAGNYDFTFEYTLERGGAQTGIPEQPVAPNLFAAIQQQLGLQLVAKKLPFPVVVVDAFEKLPAEN